MASLWIRSGEGWPLKGLGVASPDHQVGAIFEALDEDVLMELTLEIHRIFFWKICPEVRWLYFGLKSSKIEIFSIRKLLLKAHIKMFLEMSPKVHVLVLFWPKDAFAKFVCSCLLLKMFLLMRETGWYHKWLPSHASCRIKSSQSVLPSQLQIFFVFPPSDLKKGQCQQTWSSRRLGDWFLL